MKNNNNFRKKIKNWSEFNYHQKLKWFKFNKFKKRLLNN